MGFRGFGRSSLGVGVVLGLGCLGPRQAVRAHLTLFLELFCGFWRA